MLIVGTIEKFGRLCSACFIAAVRSHRQLFRPVMIVGLAFGARAFNRQRQVKVLLHRAHAC